MSRLYETGDLFDSILKEKGIDKYTYTISTSQKEELNLESGSFKLMRTVFNNTGSVKVFLDGRTGTASGNDITEEGLRQLTDDAVAAAESASPDPCHDIAPGQGSDVFRQGVEEPDMDRFIFRIKEFVDTVSKEYPEIRIMTAIGSFDSWNWFSRNTNGTQFEGIGAQYGFSLEISAGEGDETTGIDYAGFTAKDLDIPFIEAGDIRSHLESVRNSLHPEAVEGKFTGTVIMTPGCTASFLYMMLSNYVRDGVIIDGTSLWLDKVGEKVASDLLTVELKPFDERIIMGERGTQDGFRAEDVTVIDKGVLKTHVLSLYAANKTGRPVVRNTGSDLVVAPGDRTLDELIAGVDKGLLMGGFSGGAPGTNGEFSGVAKNSFLIENGKIKCAVTETMVNGNLGEALLNIRGISKELRCNGSGVIPYIAVDGIVISGK